MNIPKLGAIVNIVVSLSAVALVTFNCAGLAFSQEYQWGSGGLSANEFDIRDYGGIPNADYDNSTACEAAAAAAGAFATANPGQKGVVWFPAGNWGMGADGSSQVYSGCKIDEDNVIIDGDKNAKIAPRGSDGNYALVFCKTATDANCGNALPSATLAITGTTAANPVVLTVTTGHLVTAGEYVYIWGSDQTELNQRFHEVTAVGATTLTLGNENGLGRSTSSTGTLKVDVEALSGVGVRNIQIDGGLLGANGETGHSQYYIVHGTPSGGTPARYDDVTITNSSSADDGWVVWHDSTSSPPRTAISTDQSGDGTSPVGSNLSFSAGAWTVSGIDNTDTDEFTAVTTEGSHGIIFAYVRGFDVNNVTFTEVSDEAIDVVFSSGGSVSNNFFDENGQEEEGGSGLSISGSTDITVNGNRCVGGDDALIQNGSCITIATNNTHPISNISIKGNNFSDTGVGPEHIESIVQISCSQADIMSDVVFEENTITQTPPDSDDIPGSTDFDHKFAIEGSSTADCTYTFKSNDIDGFVDIDDNHDGIWIANDFDLTSGTELVAGTAFDGIGLEVKNNSFDVADGGVNLNFISRIVNSEAGGRTAIWRGNTFTAATGAIALDCINLFNGVGDPASTITIDNNTFDTCGENGSDHAVEGTGAVDNVAVTNNVYNNNAVGAGWRLELGGSPSAPCYDAAAGSGSGNSCSGNTVEN